MSDWKISIYLRLVENWNVSTTIRQNLPFLSTLSATLLRYEINKQRYKLLVNLCNSDFDDIATARGLKRHRELKITYIEHNLFIQSERGRDVELQKTHIVLFKSPLDKMPVTTLVSSRSCIRTSWLVLRQNVCSRLSFVEFSRRPDERLSYCTNSGYVH